MGRNRSTRKQKERERKKQRQRREQQEQERHGRKFLEAEEVEPPRNEPKGAARKEAKEKPLPVDDTGKGTAPAHGEGEGKEQGGRKLMMNPPAVTTPYIATRKKGTSYDLP